MKILHLHPGPDTGGQSMRGKPLLEAAGHEVRVFVRSRHPFGYPEPMHWDPVAVSESVDWADVVVVHNEPILFVKAARRRSKPLIVHHHGSIFRRGSRFLYPMAKAFGALQVVSTVDLLLEAPDLHWQPQNIDLAEMAAIRAANYPADGRLRLAHAPTNRRIKGTDAVMRVARNLSDDMDFVLIERETWGNCLRRKATADIYVDQFGYGYGNNAIEAWAMGMPVLAGASEPILDRMRAEYGKRRRLPFYITDEARLQDDLRTLAGSAGLRAEWAERGLAHVQRFHAPDRWVARFEELAGMALERFAAARRPAA